MPTDTQKGPEPSRNAHTATKAAVHVKSASQLLSPAGRGKGTHKGKKGSVESGTTAADDVDQAELLRAQLISLRDKCQQMQKDKEGAQPASASAVGVKRPPELSKKRGAPPPKAQPELKKGRTVAKAGFPTASSSSSTNAPSSSSLRQLQQGSEEEEAEKESVQERGKTSEVRLTQGQVNPANDDILRRLIQLEEESDRQAKMWFATAQVVETLAKRFIRGAE